MNLFKEEEPQPIEILGKELRCPVCTNHLFFYPTSTIKYCNCFIF